MNLHYYQRKMSEKLKILIIDDSEDDRLLYMRALRKSGGDYKVMEANDGEVGLELISKELPDCILLDYSMPGRDGVEVLKRIRTKHQFIPVVMLTGMGNERVAVAAMQEGAQNYISKSTITSETLSHTVLMAIEHCKLQRRIHEQRTSLEVFTRALAHDLKEPVRTVKSFLELINQKWQFPDNIAGYLQHIVNATERMEMLIEAVFFYTKLDTPLPAASESCNFYSIMQDVKENLAKLISESNAVVICGKLPEKVNVNRIQSIQLLQNLISNAIVHCETTPEINISAEESLDTWLFKVSDNGPGVSASNVEKIFMPFKRLSHHKSQGLGLGLATCKKIVEMHGGRIWCESNRSSAGTVFNFTIPKNPATQNIVTLQQQNKITGKELNDVNGRLANILLVEDNEADIELAKIMLMEQPKVNCNMSFARDGDEALAKLNDSPCDLMLLDINLPGIDGFELLKQLRSTDKFKNLKVIMCSTSTYDKDIEHAKSQGAIAYINKPPRFEILKAIIEKNTDIQISSKNGINSLLHSA